MAHTLAEYLDNHDTLKSRPQDTSQATPAPKILQHQLKVLSHVCPQTQTSSQIFNIARLVSLSRLSVSVSWNERKLKLKSVHEITDPAILELSQQRLRPGQFIYHEGVMMVACAEGTVLGVREMVLPFSHVINAERFYRDHAPRADRVFYMFYTPLEETREVGCS